MSFLTIASKLVAFSDSEATSQPLMKNFDWTMGLKNLTISDPKSFSGTLGAGLTTTIFDGTRATTLDNTTAWDTSLSTLDSGTRYRFTWTDGTDPTLREDRGMTLSSQPVQVIVNADSTVDMVLGNGGLGAFPYIFGGGGSTIIAGDILFIPGEITGDAAGPFNAENTGFWVVLNVFSPTDIQLARLPGESFTASGETITLTSDTQLQIFAADGVQVGDSVSISSGFAVSSRRTYIVDRVTSTWFEVVSSAAIPIQADIRPTAAGLIFYSDGKRFVHLEADQEAVVRFDGDTGDTCRCSPAEPGDRSQPGWVQKFGPCHKLILVNKSSVSLNYVAHSAR